MSLVNMWGLVRKGWLLLLVCTLLGLAAGIGVSLLQPKRYSATSTGYVVAGNSGTVGDAFAGKNLAAEKAATYLPLVQSRSVANRIAEDLNLDPNVAVGALKGSTEGVIFRITATADSPELAAKMADAAIRATSIEANALETLTVTGESTGSTVVRIVPVELALTPTSAVSPNVPRNVVLGLALGVLAGLGLVVVRHTLDRRIRLATDAENIAGASSLGIIPKASELAGSGAMILTKGAAAEALRQLRTNLRFVSVDDPARSIVVTSSNENEGKSTVASQLAMMLAESGQPTVLIDADVRRPVQATHFGVDGHVGLTQLLVGSIALEDALVQTDQQNLLILPAGRIPPNPSELVGSKRMKTLIDTLAQSYMVILDAPPLLPVTDAALLTVASDGAILVVQSGKTRTEELGLAAHKLDQIDATLFGVVLNMVPKKDLGSAAFGYGYGSYGSTYYDSAEDERDTSRRRSSSHKPFPKRARRMEATTESTR
ncbi:polysaccharide biosynthesis tyrosine autokinase [Aestuariimicrobium sp. Y1814]|uniref:polysaccharide biosynthesis tyrosine autokinase n=1 Tax=Aestuariimicrobium sp. Y1814 TaxID=3418742 RepID=UPI003DA7734B